MKKICLSVCLLFILFTPVSFSQDDLLNILNQDEKPQIDYTNATFKTSRVVIGHSIENPAKGEMLFLVTHHFGAINTGYENLFGIKQATIRLGLEYGVTKWFGLGVGLNTDRNTWDGFLKVKLLRQSKGGRNMPFTLDFFANTVIYTHGWKIPDQKNYFSSSVTYTFEFLLARKFGKRLSFQLMPALVHKNLVQSASDHNDIFSIGAGGRIKISNRVSVNAEYHYLLPDQIFSEKMHSSLSVGIDIETGGHVFQIFLTNSTGEYEQAFLTETRGAWNKGDIFLGFNITRVFTIF
jgi:hypothetical protein